MYFERFYEKGLAHASYTVGCQASGEAMIVDPLRDGDSIELVEVMHTPGHTLEQLSFLVTDRAVGGEPPEVNVNGFDRGEEVMVYCESGGRSAVAASMLVAHGIERVKNLADGFAAWRAMADAPIEKTTRETRLHERA